jgi:hypothetical protein
MCPICDGTLKVLRPQLAMAKFPWKEVMKREQPPGCSSVNRRRCGGA